MPAQEEPSQPETAAQVSISASYYGDLHYGTEITLRATLTDFDEEYAIEWQYSTDGGATFRTVDGAEGYSFDYILDEQNISYIWRAMARSIDP